MARTRDDFVSMPVGVGDLERLLKLAERIIEPVAVFSMDPEQFARNAVAECIERATDIKEILNLYLPEEDA